jgi:hypothetical protein
VALQIQLRSPVCDPVRFFPDDTLKQPFRAPQLPIQDGQQVNTLRAADEIPLKAARIPVDFPEATMVRATMIGRVSDPSSSCPSPAMLERGPPIITPVADGSGSPFSSKMAAYRRVLPRRSGRRPRLPCMICLGVERRARARKAKQWSATQSPSCERQPRSPSVHCA